MLTQKTDGTWLAIPLYGGRKLKFQTKREAQAYAEGRMIHGSTREYLYRLPKVVPADRIVVHNQVRPRRSLNSEGFRAWLQPADEGRIEACQCGWAPTLAVHYRVAGWLSTWQRVQQPNGAARWVLVEATIP
jgi:hypothetical protein